MPRQLFRNGIGRAATFLQAHQLSDRFARVAAGAGIGRSTGADLRYPRVSIAASTSEAAALRSRRARPEGGRGGSEPANRNRRRYVIEGQLGTRAHVENDRTDIGCRCPRYAKRYRQSRRTHAEPSPPLRERSHPQGSVRQAGACTRSCSIWSTASRGDRNRMSESRASRTTARTLQAHPARRPAVTAGRLCRCAGVGKGRQVDIAVRWRSKDAPPRRGSRIRVPEIHKSCRAPLVRRDCSMALEFRVPVDEGIDSELAATLALDCARVHGAADRHGRDASWHERGRELRREGGSRCCSRRRSCLGGARPFSRVGFDRAGRLNIFL